MVPSDPTEYRKWLERKRAEYSAAEACLEKTIFKVNLAQAWHGTVTPLAACGLEDLKCIPSYDGPPPCD
jgi:hypothetical protein